MVPKQNLYNLISKGINSWIFFIQRENYGTVSSSKEGANVIENGKNGIKKTKVNFSAKYEN